VAAVVALVAVVALLIRTRQGVADWRSWGVVAALAMAGALVAAGWRVLTAGGNGANIGGGLMLLIGPALIAALLMGATWIAWGGGRQRLMRTWLLTLAATFVALYAVLAALGSYDASAGLITARQYADVRIGQTRSAVHERLGRGGEDLTYVIFAPPAPGLLCDFYSDKDHAYQLCFRASVLVSKDLRTYPVTVGVS
jgi:hypothetical protein